MSSARKHRHNVRSRLLLLAKAQDGVGCCCRLKTDRTNVPCLCCGDSCSSVIADGALLSAASGQEALVAVQQMGSCARGLVELRAAARAAVAGALKRATGKSSPECCSEEQLWIPAV